MAKKVKDNKVKSYTADDIEVLDSINACRKSVGMFLGSSDTQVLHAFREIYENAVDVFIKDMNDFVAVSLSTDKKAKEQTFTVIDRGPGIPVEINKKTKISTLTTVLTTLHSGSNFDKSKKGKAASRGKHGVGSVATVATSKIFTVYTCRDEQWYKQVFEQGKVVTEVEKCKFPSKYAKLGAKKDRGTIIEFIPDYTVLPRTIIPEKELFEFVRQNALLNNGLKVHFVSETLDEVIHNKNGIVTLIEEFIANQKKINTLGKPFIYEDDILQVALQWSDLEGEHPRSYVNSSLTPGLGTHVQGLYDAITKAFKDVAGRGVDFTAADLREGLIAIIHYKCTDDDYAGQNKEKLNTASATGIVKEHLSKPLAKWVKTNNKLVREISLRATKIKAAKMEARAITRAASNLKTNNKSVLIGNGKLVMSNKNCPPEKRELYIVEGDSAAGGLIKERDSQYQEVLKLRGKALNVAKTTSIAKDLQNAEISNFLIAIGADAKKIKKGEKVDSFRLGKIILLSDEDTDGEHIKVLLFSILDKYAPEAFNQGIVYIAKLPLFQASDPKTGKKVFGNNLQEVQEKGGRDWQVSRLKGLGEMDPDELAPFALYPDTRELIRVNYFSDKKEREEYLKMVGNDITYRKEMLGVN